MRKKPSANLLLIAEGFLNFIKNDYYTLFLLLYTASPNRDTAARASTT